MRKGCVHRLKTRSIVLAALLIAASLIVSSCAGMPRAKAKVTSDADYSKSGMWACLGNDGSAAGKEADCFMICPTVYVAMGKDYNMSIADPVAKIQFTGAANEQKGIYSESCAVYSPFYRQASIEVYSLDASESQKYFDTAYSDVEKAFLYYLKNYNHGRPLVLAGFSQGADMCIRLLKDHGDDPLVKKILVACYAIGWRVTDEDISKYPHLKPASGENDTGVIVSYDCEAIDLKSSLVVPKGAKTRSINPLNWKTDSTPADKSLNKGSLIADGSMIQGFTGCYIDPERGSLKVTDVEKSNYPSGPSCFSPGEYHVYDFRFFYRNLQENVSVRIKAFESKGK